MLKRLMRAALLLVTTVTALARPASVSLTLSSMMGGCSPTPSPESSQDVINGQVFIVTRSGENVKLGLVTVLLLPEQELRKRVALTEARAKADQEDLRPELERARTAVSDAKIRILQAERACLQAKQARDEAHVRSQGESPSETLGNNRWLDAITAENEAEDVMNSRLDLLNRARMSLATRLTEVSDLIRRYDDLGSSARYFEGLPTALASAQTDADGKFSLHVPKKGRYAVAAHAQRQVLDVTEEYFWLVLVPEEAREGTPVLISNQTLTTGQSPLSVIRAVK